MHTTRCVALSGLGSIARQHAAALRRIPGVDIVAFDPSDALRESAEADGLVDRTVGSFDELVALAPSALVIAGPDHVHLEQLEQSARRGIPTLVEKPLADRLAAAAAAVPRIEATGTPVIVGYVLRHRTVVETARRLVHDGIVGTPTSFQVMLGAYGTITAAASRFATPAPDRLYRDYSHEWDYLRWIFGPISEVTAVARATHEVPHVESPNLVDALLAHDAGVVGAVHIDYADRRGTRTLHVIGTGGTLFADIARGRVTVRRAGEDFDQLFDLAEPPAEPLARQAAHLLAVAAGEEAPRVGIRDGLAALTVTEALIASARDHRWTPVRGHAD